MTLDDYRKMANGTSNGGQSTPRVLASALARVRFPRPANSPWTDVDRLPR